MVGQLTMVFLLGIAVTLLFTLELWLTGRPARSGAIGRLGAAAGVAGVAPFVSGAAFFLAHASEPLMSRHIGNLGLYWLAAAVILPGSLLAAWSLRILTRSNIVALAPLLAAAVSTVAGVETERATHGPLYIRSAGAALWLSWFVAVAGWHAIVLTAMLGWAFRQRARVAAVRCFACGYDLRGLASPRCPECGNAAPAQPPATPKDLA